MNPLLLWPPPVTSVSCISPLSRNLPPSLPPSLMSDQTDGSTHMAVPAPSLRPSLLLHHPNALWQCRLLCSLLNGEPEIIPKLEISLPLSLCHIHPFFPFFIFSLLLRAVAPVFASTNVSTPNMHVFWQQKSLDWDPVDSADADKTGAVMLNSGPWVYLIEF